MSKKGVSLVSGNISPVVGEKYTYHIADWYRDTPTAERNPAKVTWELFRKRSNGQFTSTHIKKLGDSDFTFGESSLGNTYRLEGYLHKPEGGGLIITPKQSKIPKISKVELLYVDDSKGSTFSFREKLRTKAYCVNMFNKDLIFTLWEDDAKNSGHNESNKPIDTKKARVDESGVAVAEFLLTKALMQKAIQGEIDPKKLEFYVTVEYYKNKKHATENVDVNNPFPQTPKQTPQTPPVSSKQPSKPAAIPKAKGSPAETKPVSKKEEKGIGEIMMERGKELWDWWESKGTATKEQEPTVQKPDGKSQNQINSTDVSTIKVCECEQNRLMWGKHPKVSCKFRKKVISISKELWPNDFLNMANNLMTIMAFETNKTFDPSIQNKYGFTGLIQFGVDAAKDVGTTTDELKKMTDLQQLNYVKSYFSLSVFSGKIKNITDMYLAVNYPTMIKTNRTNPKDILYGAPKDSYYRNPALMYEERNGVKERDNRPFGKKEEKYGFTDGNTYVWEITAAMNEYKGKGTELIFVKGNSKITDANSKSEAVVVTDAGHGIGGDGGNAKKGNPDNESKMTLMIETETADALKLNNIKIIRTRTVENLIGVGEQIAYRVKVAKSNNAKVFVSHHLDYVPVNKDGTVNEKGAKNTNKIGVNIHPTNLINEKGQSIRGGASSDFYKNSSLLANYIILELKKIFTDREVVLKLAKRPNISHDWLGVLKNMDGSDRAAVLLELGNTTEANTKFLIDNKQSIGKAIATGISKYLGEKPDNNSQNEECDGEIIQQTPPSPAKSNKSNCQLCNEDHYDLTDKVKWQTQFDSKWGTKKKQNVACKKTCDDILIKAGLKATSSGNLYQTALENKNHTAIIVDIQNSKQAIAYINSELKKGHPVQLGVDHKLGYGYNEGTTDHFVVVIGKGCENGKIYYKFYDVGTSFKEKGASEKNRLYLSPTDYSLKGSTVYNGNFYTVTQVRKNL